MWNIAARHWTRMWHGPGSTGLAASVKRPFGTFKVSPIQRRAYRYRRGYNPEAFKRTQSMLHRWAARPTFYYECGGLGLAGTGFYVYNLEEVPVTGRRRFNIVSDEFLKTQGDGAYQETLQQYRRAILPDNHPLHVKTQRILERLIPHSGLPPEHNSWELHIIGDQDLVNAFVLPGGKVFVGAGLFKVCTTDDMIAAVIGHEISHNTAKHSAERFSRASIFIPIFFIGSVLLGLGDFANMSRIFVDLALLRPNSRAQESEADHIGLLMMAEACYDPAAAADVWERMDRLAEMQNAPPQILSTHPSNVDRRQAIQGWLNEAQIKREGAGCGPTAGWAGDFYKTSQRWI